MFLKSQTKLLGGVYRIEFHSWRSSSRYHRRSAMQVFVYMILLLDINFVKLLYQHPSLLIHCASSLYGAKATVLFHRYNTHSPNPIINLLHQQQSIPVYYQRLHCSTVSTFICRRNVAVAFIVLLPLVYGWKSNSKVGLPPDFLCCGFLESTGDKKAGCNVEIFQQKLTQKILISQAVFVCLVWNVLVIFRLQAPRNRSPSKTP